MQIEGKLYEEQTFKTIVFVVVLAYNIFFLLVWLSHFVSVLTRHHFLKI